MSLFTRDDARYWEGARPTDHNAVGLFIDGPQPAEPITNRLARLTRSRCDVTAEGPQGAKQRMAREAQRRLELIDRRTAFLEMIAGGKPMRRRGRAA